MPRVTKEQFIEFLNNYPNPVEHVCHTICEPVLHAYHDWSLADGTFEECTVDHHLQCRIATYYHDWIHDEHVHEIEDKVWKPQE